MNFKSKRRIIFYELLVASCEMALTYELWIATCKLIVHHVNSQLATSKLQSLSEKLLAIDNSQLANCHISIKMLHGYLSQ